MRRLAQVVIVPYVAPMTKIDETRLNVPMPQDLRDAVEKRWREVAGCRGASEYVRNLIEKDIADGGKEQAAPAGA